jgi:predicted RNase H-like HicB family nuclease
MLTEYIHLAMRRAKYEILDDGSFFGEILGFQGVWANAALLEDCREQLRQALEDWIVLGLRMGHDLPVVENIQLVPSRAD